MKYLKKTLIIFLSFIHCQFAFSKNVFDQAGLLNVQQISALEEKLQYSTEKHEIGIYIVTIQDFEKFGYDIEDAAENIYNKNGFGYGELKKGLLFLVSMNDRSFDIDSFNTGKIFNYSRKEILQESFLDDFRNNDWFNGFFDFAETIEDILIRYENGEYEENYTLYIVLGCFAFALIVALILFHKEKSKLNNVAFANEASNYEAEDGLNLSVNNDIFKYSTVQHITHSSSSSSGGGGGGHSHSSGHF